MKTITIPKKSAGEYARYSVNFYNGCSNGCSYCYLKRGVLSRTLGGNMPELQKKYQDTEWALQDFKKDIYYSKQREDIKKNGLFFTFTSDPLLPETKDLNIKALKLAIQENIPCTLLTKRSGEAMSLMRHIPEDKRKYVAVGFTLTGRDDKEENASPNEARIAAMEQLRMAGFHTWASIEPIVDVESSLNMIKQTEAFSEHYKVGLMSKVKKDYYNNDDLAWLFSELNHIFGPTIYLKDSFIERLSLDREKLSDPFVGRDYNLFCDL